VTQGSMAAVNAVENNRQLVETEKQALARLKQGKTKAEQNRLDAAACFLIKCSAEFPADSQEYAYYKALENKGAGLKTEQAALLAYSKTTSGANPNGDYPAFRKVTTSGLFTYTANDRENDSRTLAGNLYLNNLAAFTGLDRDTVEKIGTGLALFGIVANGKGSGSGLKTPNSQIGAIGSGVDKRLPVPEKVTASNGLGYKSNSKHTLGGSSNNPKAGIEPPNSLELFNNSIPASGDSKKRFTVDSNGHVHQFTDSNDGSFHWAGSTSDARSPLTLTNRTKADLRKAGYTSKVLK
jgi:hypothetical protein